MHLYSFLQGYVIRLLMFAKLVKYNSSFRYLLSLGASVEAENENGEKPADLIDPDCKELLKLFETGCVWALTLGRTWKKASFQKPFRSLSWASHFVWFSWILFIFFLGGILARHNIIIQYRGTPNPAYLFLLKSFKYFWVKHSIEQGKMKGGTFIHWE